LPLPPVQLRWITTPSATDITGVPIDARVSMPRCGRRDLEDGMAARGAEVRGDPRVAQRRHQERPSTEEPSGR
jgi:hypothetical protein